MFIFDISEEERNNLYNSKLGRKLEELLREKIFYSEDESILNNKTEGETTIYIPPTKGFFYLDKTIFNEKQAEEFINSIPKIKILKSELSGAIIQHIDIYYYCLINNIHDKIYINRKINETLGLFSALTRNIKAFDIALGVQIITDIDHE